MERGSVEWWRGIYKDEASDGGGFTKMRRVVEEGFTKMRQVVEGDLKR